MRRRPTGSNRSKAIARDNTQSISTTGGASVSYGRQEVLPMWKLSTTIKGVRAQPQTVLRVTTLPKGRKANPAKPSPGHHQAHDAEHARGHAHTPPAYVADSTARL